MEKGSKSHPSLPVDDEPAMYGGMEEDVIIFFLLLCMVEQERTHAQTRWYFQEVLGLTDWTVNPYRNIRTDMVTVWKQGEDSYLHYFIDDLPRLKSEGKLRGGTSEE